MKLELEKRNPFFFSNSTVSLGLFASLIQPASSILNMPTTSVTGFEDCEVLLPETNSEGEVLC